MPVCIFILLAKKMKTKFDEIYCIEMRNARFMPDLNKNTMKMNEFSGVEGVCIFK